MPADILDLNVTENYGSLTKLTQAQLNEAMDSIETAINEKSFRNLEQLARDAFGDALYDFNEDGVATVTNTLFDKQSEEIMYDGGDISINNAADLGWVDVDNINASIAFTPEKPGKYKATFVFSHRVSSLVATEMDAETTFRVSDGTEASGSVSSGGLVPAGVAAGKFVNPVTVVHEFNWNDTLVKSVALQKWNRVASNVDQNFVGASDASGVIFAYIEKV